MKTTILTLIVILGFATAQINAQGFVWAEGMGSEGDDAVMAQKTDAQGNHFLAGYFSGEMMTFGNTTLYNSNGTNLLPDLFVAKFDSDWNPLWAYSPDDDANAYGDITNSMGMDVDNLGQCYMVGSYKSPQITFGTTTLSNEGGNDHHDVFIVKFEEDGNISWASGFGGTATDKGQLVQVDPGGAYLYISGWFYSENMWVGNTLLENVDASNNTSDIFISKMSGDGSYMWAKKGGSDNIDRVHAAQLEPSGKLVLSGTYKGHFFDYYSFMLQNSNPFFNDIFTMIIDENGQNQLLLNAGGMLDDAVSSVAVDVNGNILVAGAFYSPTLVCGGTSLSNTTQSGNPESDAFVINCNSEGNVVWAHKCGGVLSDAITSVRFDGENSVYVGGVFTSDEISIDGIVLSNAGFDNTSDVFIAKYNPYGNVEWADKAGGTGNDYISTLFVSEPDDVVLAGQSDDVAIYGNVLVPNLGGIDIVVAHWQNNLNLFSGKAFYDSNKNGQQDENEVNVPNMVCQVGDEVYATDKNGEFSIYLEPGTYSFIPQNSEFFEPVPNHINFQFSGYGETNENNTIALQAVADTAILEFNVMTLPSLRKGQEFITYYSFKNVGTDTLSQTRLGLPLMQEFIFENSTPPEDSITADSIYWDIPALLPFEEQIIVVTQQVDTTLGIDTNNYKNSDAFIIICRWHRVCRWWVYWQLHIIPGVVSYTIDPVTGDTTDSICSNGWTYNVDVNGDTIGQDCLPIYWWQPHFMRICWWRLHCWIINFPHDPNEISVEPSDSIPFTPQQLAAREPLEYTIRFQNTGSDTCFNAVVIDTLSDKLDPSTFEMITASKAYSVDLRGNVLKFTFNNILLPDSTSNEPESHAYIRYRVTPRENLEIGDSIPNTANIYFDYEPAVVTNTVYTVIGVVQGVDENDRGSFHGKAEGKVNIHPNPFDESATVEIPADYNEDTFFEIYDIAGRRVKAIQLGRRKKFRINRDAMKPGMYIYMLKTINQDLLDRGKMIIN